MLLYLQGMLVGIPAIFFVGPVLLTLLQASLENGFRSGLAVAIGIAISDITCIALAYFGVARYIFADPAHRTLVGVSGGIIVIGFGIALMVSRPHFSETPVSLGRGHFAGLIAKGFLVNTANPTVFGYWISALGIMSSRISLTPINVLIFFAGAITVILGTDALKALLAERLKAYLKSELLLKINRWAGVALIILGVALILRILLVPMSH